MIIPDPVSALDYIAAGYSRPNPEQFKTIAIMEGTSSRCTAFVHSRQSGVSTAIIASAVFYAVKNDHKTVALISHDYLDTSRQILDCLEFIWGPMAGGLVYESQKRLIRFVNGSYIKIISARANMTSQFRGWGINRMYADVNIFNADWMNVMQNVLPTIASTNGKMFFFFTATNSGDANHKFWMQFRPQDRHVIERKLSIPEENHLIQTIGYRAFLSEYKCKFL